MQFMYRELLGCRFTVVTFGTLLALRTALSQKNLVAPHLIIADILLPDGSLLKFMARNGLDLFKSFPVILVSSIDNLQNLRHCFELGACDYLTKPFHRSELIAKVERHLFKKPLSGNLNDDLEILPTSLTVRYKSFESNPLTPKELQIVAYLGQADHNRMSRDRLAQKVWDRVFVSRKTFDVHLSHLRRKLRCIGLEISFCSDGTYHLRDAMTVGQDNQGIGCMRSSSGNPAGAAKDPKPKMSGIKVELSALTTESLPRS